MNFSLVNNYELKPPRTAAIAAILKVCFSEYPKDKIHLKQCPSFRLLVDDQQNLVGHLAVDHRWMNNGGTLIKVFGLSDICVPPEYRSQKIATQMIQKIFDLAQDQAIDFLILIAWDPKIYLSMGFQKVDNPCRWLLIQSDQSLGLAQRNIPNGLMIKPISGKKWNDGLLDFLGPIF